MNTYIKNTLLVLTLATIIGSIWYLESLKVPVAPGGGGVEIELMTVAEKEDSYDRAVEITNPTGYLNSDPFLIADLIGEKVILVDFWTYSCINCQRTIPVLNAWYDKYEDDGLVIIGIHSPEFEFEKFTTNVQAAIEKFGIKYPVVQDNDKGTWRAYQNRYWPREYLIDIDGYIVYDHIGEGAYDQTESKIQELLAERAEKLGLEITMDSTMIEIEADTSEANTPEIYFGAGRNSSLANGTQFATGIQTLTVPDSLQDKQLYLDGIWDIEGEFAVNQNSQASIVLNYEAKNVFMVASSDEPVDITILIDGEEVRTITVQADQLYKIFEHNKAEAHTLEIIIQGTGLKAYTFTFG